MFSRWTGFPPEIWQATLALAAVVIAKLCVDDGAMVVGMAILMALDIAEDQARALMNKAKR